MRSVVFASLFALLISGCALRPRYADFVTPTTAGKEVTFLVTDAATHQPVPNAKIEVSELKNKLSVTTGADGTFKLPVEKKYLDENPVFLVTLPKGFEEYRVALAPLPAVESPDAPRGPPPPALEALPDAGSNG
jgi:hypothetical protein